MCHRILIPLLAIAAFAGTATAAEPVPTEYVGKWVPATGGCTAPVHMLVAADKLTVVNGKDTQALGGIEMAGPGYFAPDYTGILAVLITEFDGDQPAVATFNVGEKKGVAQLDFGAVQPGQGNATMAAYNARVSKLNLAKRFPLDKVLLKKCAP
ncbi:MAG: hypothetical protein ABIX37_08960 [Gammaproteobacteria bacterium]